MTLPTGDPVQANENLVIDNPALDECMFPDSGERNAWLVHDLVSEFATCGAEPSDSVRYPASVVFCHREVQLLVKPWTWPCSHHQPGMPIAPPGSVMCLGVRLRTVR
jgi:hypothetical protein